MFHDTIARLGALALVCALTALFVNDAHAQAPATPVAQDPGSNAGTAPTQVFDMGQIVVIGSPDGQPVVGGSLLTSQQIWSFDRQSLDQAMNIVPGVMVARSDSV